MINSWAAACRTRSIFVTGQNKLIFSRTFNKRASEIIVKKCETVTNEIINSLMYELHLCQKSSAWSAMHQVYLTSKNHAK